MQFLKKPFLNNLHQLALIYLIACSLFIISVLLVQYNDSQHVFHIKKLKYSSNLSSNREDSIIVFSSNNNDEKETLNIARRIPSTIKQWKRNIIQWNKWNNSTKIPAALTCDANPPIQGGPILLTQEELCNTQIGCGLLHVWKKHAYSLCEEIPPSAFQRIRKYVMGNYDTFPTNMMCYSMNNTQLPTGTSPHTACDASNMVFDFSKMVHAPCLRYRPGYFCKKPTYYNYNETALMGNCRRTDAFKLSLFSNDFGKDIFSSFKTFEEINYVEKEGMQYFDGVTIFVSREQDEHVNMFHSMTDFFATYVMIEMFQLNSSDVQIVLLDEHYDGPFDFLWNSVFSLKRPMMRASQFNNSTVRFERAIFQPSGYATQFFSHLLDFNSLDKKMCHSKVEIIKGFSNRIMNGLNIKKRIPNKHDLLKVLFISRKPYEKNGINHKYMGRQISNENELITSLRTNQLTNSTCIVESIDFAHLTLIEQIQKVQNSDVLIGYHGAGLTHTLWLPQETSAVIEIWKTPRIRSWRCFEQLTLWRGNVYNLWVNTEPKTIRVDKLGDYLRVNPVSFLKSYNTVISNLISVRNKTLS